MHSFLLGWEPYVAFVGLVLTLYATYVERKKSRFPCQVTFYVNETIPLVGWISRSLPHLSILYRDTAVRDTTMFVSAYLVNSGHRDIMPDMVERRLTIRLPKGYTWIVANVGDKSTGLTAACTLLSASELEINAGLFRVGEYIELVGLLDIPENARSRSPDDIVRRALLFDHRITDTGPIERKTFSSMRGRSPHMMGITAGIFLLTLAAVVTVLFDVGGVTRTLSFYRVAGPGLVVHTDVTPNADGTVSIASDDGLKAGPFRGDQMAAQYRWSIAAERSALYPWVAALVTIYLLLTGSLLTHQGWKYYRFARLPPPLRHKHA